MVEDCCKLRKFHGNLYGLIMFSILFTTCSSLSPRYKYIIYIILCVIYNNTLNTTTCPAGDNLLFSEAARQHCKIFTNIVTTYILLLRYFKCRVMETRRSLCLTARSPQETVLDGLLWKLPLPNISIREVKGKGRGVFIEEEVKQNAYLMEYEFSESYPRTQRQAHESVYAINDEPCMILEALTKAGWVCLDATRATETVARLMNHSPSSEATARPFKALLVKGNWRVGFVATRDLVPGEQLTWDYGASPEGQTWLMRRPPPPTTTTPPPPATSTTPPPQTTTTTTTTQSSSIFGDDDLGLLGNVFSQRPLSFLFRGHR